MENSVESHYVPRELIEILLDLIAPYYKSFPMPDRPPEFRKTLTSEEINNVLLGVHNVVSEMMREYTQEGIHE